ncbi:GNAT family N-acetyltransferase [Brevibacillus ginsengisoli]|uniref:GNAT family N-acetyltransferase n=1 Tax=Brevibacillus ginsengisoli TaxID=363854 RepID=UPI003CF11983
MIRPARPDDKREAARLLLDAIHDIAYTLTGASTEPEVLEGLQYWFVQQGNRISYENTLVKEINGQVVGLVVFYHGRAAEMLDKPIVERLRRLFQNPEITIDKEADEDEWYIDTLSVSPDYRGRGIGSELIQAVENHVKRFDQEDGKVALNVDQTNEKAHRLYRKLGFVADKEIMINNHPYAHMVTYLIQPVR